MYSRVRVRRIKLHYVSVTVGSTLAEHLRHVRAWTCVDPSHYEQCFQEDDPQRIKTTALSVHANCVRRAGVRGTPARRFGDRVCGGDDAHTHARESEIRGARASAGARRRARPAARTVRRRLDARAWRRMLSCIARAAGRGARDGHNATHGGCWFDQHLDQTS